MERLSRAQDENSLVAQGSESLANLHVDFRRQRAVQAHGNDRHIGFRKHDHERHKDPMIVSPLGVKVTVQPRVTEESLDFLSQLGIARCIVLVLVRFGRKTAVVVVHGRIRTGGNLDGIRFPMRAQDHNRLGLLGGKELGSRFLQVLRDGRLFPQEWEWTATMIDEHGGEAQTCRLDLHGV